VTGKLAFPSKPLSGISAASGAISAPRKEDKAIAKRVLMKRKPFAPESFKA
jgi:hypothetical protein